MTLAAGYDGRRGEPQSLAAAIAQAFVDTVAPQAAASFLEWSARLPVPGRGALDFELFPFQREWYTDEIVHARHVCWIKATQVGVSEYAVRW